MRVILTQKLLLISIILVATHTLAQAQHKAPKRLGKYESGPNFGAAFGRKISKFFYNSPRYHLPESGAGLVSYSGAIGTSTYYGDLSAASLNSKSFVFRPNIGVQHYYRLGYHFNIKTELNYVRLESKDYYPQRGLSFREGNVELYTSLMYDILAFQKRYKKRSPINPYVFVGLGAMHFNPMGQYNGHWYALEPLKLEGHGYPRTTAIIPFGLGIRIKYIRGFDFIVEGGYRKCFTDYLDNVSSKSYTFFPDNTMKNYLSSPNGSTIQRGNPTRDDGYFVFQVKVVYTPKMKYVSIPRYRHKVGTRSGI